VYGNSCENLKNSEHTPPLRSAPNNIIFAKKSNQALFAPGCEFVVSDTFSDEIGTKIKLRIADEVRPETETRIMDTSNTNPNIWDVNYDQFNLNLFEDADLI